MSEFVTQRAPTREVARSETNPYIVDWQIAEGLQAEANSARPFLRNFNSNLPGGFIRSSVAMMHAEDKMVVDATDEQETPNMYGNRAQSTTWRTFFAEIDFIMGEVGVTEIEARRLARDLNAAEELRDYILPVYRGMRLRGYAHAELIR